MAHGALTGRYQSESATACCAAACYRESDNRVEINNTRETGITSNDVVSSSA